MTIQILESTLTLLSTLSLASVVSGIPVHKEMEPSLGSVAIEGLKCGRVNFVEVIFILI